MVQARLSRWFGSAMHRGRQKLSSLQSESTENIAAKLDAELSGWFCAEKSELAPGFAIAKDDVVVDVGCGPGYACLFSANRGARVVGIDVNAAAIERLAAKFERFRNSDHPCQAMVSDCNPIPLADDYATVVLAMEVLEHVDDPQAFLKELVRIGKPGARYLLQVPDSLGESVQREIAPPEYWAKPNHVRVFQRDEFRNAATSAGLVVERQFFFSFYWSMWWMLYWAVPKNAIPPGHSGDSALLKHWNETWRLLLSTPKGREIAQSMQNAMPKSQVLIACKPGALH